MSQLTNAAVNMDKHSKVETDVVWDMDRLRGVLGLCRRHPSHGIRPPVQRRQWLRLSLGALGRLCPRESDTTATRCGRRGRRTGAVGGDLRGGEERNDADDVQLRHHDARSRAQQNRHRPRALRGSSGRWLHGPQRCGLHLLLPGLCIRSRLPPFGPWCRQACQSGKRIASICLARRYLGPNHGSAKPDEAASIHLDAASTASTTTMAVCWQTLIGCLLCSMPQVWTC